LPFEIHELMKRVTVVRAGALIVNLAIVVYLVYAKHLFGVHRDRAESGPTDAAGNHPVFSPPF
jgi:uncharacterized membrane protein (DUF2068 family)